MDLVKNLKSGYFQIRFQPLLISLSWWKVDDRNQHIRLYFESKFHQNWIICWFFIDFLNRAVDQLPTPSMRCRYEQKLFFFFYKKLRRFPFTLFQGRPWSVHSSIERTKNLNVTIKKPRPFHGDHGYLVVTWTDDIISGPRGLARPVARPRRPGDGGNCLRTHGPFHGRVLRALLWTRGPPCIKLTTP